jgi:septation ring formation regulator EzrA
MSVETIKNFVRDIQALVSECDGLKSEIEMANARIEALEEMLEKETESGHEVHGTLASLCDILFESETRAMDHGYEGVEERAIDLVCVLKRTKSALKDREDHNDDMWSAMAAVIKVLWDDENATNDHGYSDIERRARHVMRELKRYKNTILAAATESDNQLVDSVRESLGQNPPDPVDGSRSLPDELRQLDSLRCDVMEMGSRLGERIEALEETINTKTKKEIWQVTKKEGAALLGRAGWWRGSLGEWIAPNQSSSRDFAGALKSIGLELIEE